MKLPIFILHRDELVPIVNTKFLLELPSAKKDELILDKHTYRCIFVISKDDNPLPDNIMDSIFHLGLEVRALEKEEVDDVCMFTFQILNTVIISNIQIDDNYIARAEYELHSLAEDPAVLQALQSAFNTILNKKNLIPLALSKLIEKISDPLKRMDLLADFLLRKNDNRLQYVMANDYKTKLDILFTALRSYKNSPGQKKSSDKLMIPPVLENVTQKQIQETFMAAQEAEEPLDLESYISKTVFPANVQPTITKELEKLQRVPKTSTEYGLILDWLSWVKELPLNIITEQKIDLENFQSVLDKTHYGLSDVKRYVLEHFTMQQISGDVQGTVLCFTGPPGTGKTSIAKQIAYASGRPLYRIALGGISDENELRGHRRTYTASRPGRIIAGLKETKTMSPLFLLDEIDKISYGHGDPMAALLEILDPEQNTHFVDRYFEFPVDISKAMFICTSNNIESVHSALKDRMEVIEFRNYTKDEINIIINTFLIPKILADYKIQSFPIKIADEVISTVASHYRIRQAEKILRQLYKSAAVQIFVYKKDSILIDMAFYNAIANSKNIISKEPIGFRM